MAKRKEREGFQAQVGDAAEFDQLEEAQVTVEYEDEEAEEEQKKVKIPKAVYRVSLILLALVLGLALWINRESLSPENIWSWIKLQVMGPAEGDGFPVQITGSNVFASNFSASNGSAVILSDTALTILSPAGKEELSLRHSLNQPVLCQSYGKYLLYNADSTGYLLISGTETVLNSSADKEILAGAVCPEGKFALGVQGSDGASELNVYQKTGELQFHYLFARDYITAVALNYDGSYGAVCTVRSEKGEMVSKVTVFDFSQAEPIAEYESNGRLLVGAGWSENGTIYAVGDTSLLIASSSDYAFKEYDYSGRSLTAFRLDAGRAFLSVSAYEHAGPSTLLIFREKEEPLRIEAEERIECLSVAGGTVGALIGTKAVFYDYSTGAELSSADAGSDAKSLALANESMAYVLGVSEVRTIEAP